MSESIVLIGGSGHAKVVIDCIRASGGQVFGILDDGIPAGTQILGVPVLGVTAAWPEFQDHPFLIAIGSNRVRRMLAEKMAVRWATVIHPRATVSPYAQLGEGTVVMPHAVINACATVGKHCIINTGAVAEHDNLLGDYVHLSPNAALGGTVTVGAGTHIGIGACVRNNIRICEGCTVGAGAAVVRDITVPGTYVGIPAGRIK